MFTPKLNTGRQTHSPFSSGIGTPKSSKRRSVSIFSTHKPSPAPTPYAPSRNQTLNRSVLQSSLLVEETSQHRLEVYGSALPVLVSEALTLADRKEEPNVKLDPSGWAWLVLGRKLLVWRYKHTQSLKSSQCKELILPASELAYTADLVTILPHGSDGQSAACVAVSHEGTIRYWSSVAREGLFIEISADLKGEEAGVLVSTKSFHCVLVTTTSMLMILTPHPSQNIIQCRPLREAQGMLQGIGRRMSSLFWGGVGGAAPLPAILKQLVVGETMEDGQETFYLLTNSHLQKWALHGGSERMLYQFNIDKMLQECAAETIWSQNVSQLRKLRSWLLDVQITRDGIVILAAVLNEDVSPDLHYVLGTLHTEGPDPPQSFLSFNVPKYTNVYQGEEDDYAVLGYNLLLPDPSMPTAYMYDHKSVICLSVSSSPDKVEFQTPGDKILGAGHCGGQAIFFSNSHGLVSLTYLPQTEASADESIAMIEPLSEVEHSILGGSVDQLAEMSMSEDQTARLKAAFLHFVKGNMPASQALVSEMFPPEMSAAADPGASLDILVVAVSETLINDYPASDPRWAESVPPDGTSQASSLILLHQLEDKLNAHEKFYIPFLKRVQLWDRLGNSIVRDSAMSTRSLLCEHAEKVMAAMALRAQHSQHTTLVEEVIRRVLASRGEGRPPPGLTHQDVFYRQVSGIDEFLEHLVQYEQEQQNDDTLSSQQFVELVVTVNSIFVNVLQDAWQYRQSKAGLYQSQLSFTEPEYLPWTSSIGPQGMRSMLMYQHELSVDQALTQCGNAAERSVLFQQILEVTDICLDGYRCQLESIKQRDGESPHYLDTLHKYEQQRTSMIMPLMKHEQYEKAASLAEKYCDFGILVTLCEETENQERLQLYMNQFSSRGFADFVFKWYVQEGKRGKLMSSNLATHPQLSHFLRSKDNVFMSWLHDIDTSNFYKAHKTLKELGMQETEYLTKKKKVPTATLR